MILAYFHLNAIENETLSSVFLTLAYQKHKGQMVGNSWD